MKFVSFLVSTEGDGFGVRRGVTSGRMKAPGGGFEMRLVALGISSSLSSGVLDDNLCDGG